MENVTVTMTNLTDKAIIFKSGMVTKFTIDGKEQSKITINGIEKDLPTPIWEGDRFLGSDGAKILIEVS